MNTKICQNLLFFALLFAFVSSSCAQDAELKKAIQKQVESANDCVALAYDVKLKHLNADEIFKDCVERRAILIGMQKKYGPGKYGEVDVIDIIEGYTHLADSTNPLVEKEASTFATAAGKEDE